jgi:hypothetical protein
MNIVKRESYLQWPSKTFSDSVFIEKDNVRRVFLAVDNPSQGISRLNDCKITAHQTTPLTVQTEQGNLQKTKQINKPMIFFNIKRKTK